MTTLAAPDVLADLLHGVPAAAAHRLTGPDPMAWMKHAVKARGCTRPVRLAGVVHSVDARTGEVVATFTTADLPDGVLYKPCGTRRASVCPSCAETYRYDTYHLIAAGLRGGKGVPDSIARHPAVFATFTAPSFGPVHSRIVKRHFCADRSQCTCHAEPCRARRDSPRCEHDRSASCTRRHAAGDASLGRPLCLDCYDYAGQAAFNAFAPALWSRTTTVLQRLVARLGKAHGVVLKARYAKVAEFQRRGAVHFHALVRLDCVDTDGQTTVPPGWATADLLADLVRQAGTAVRLRTPWHPASATGWPLAWGKQLDTRPVHRGIAAGDLTEQHVAGYLAKYATKACEPAGLAATRISPENIGYYSDSATFLGRLIATCWDLGQRHDSPEYDADGNPVWPYERLRRWAHMLGFGGHFSTKSRAYSTTLRALREARQPSRRSSGPVNDDPARDLAQSDDDETVLVVGTWSYVASGWMTTADAALAMQAADAARSRRAVADPHA